MGATALLRDRMQTRILQAAGRCTRAQQDRSAVLVTGHELENYLADDRNWEHFHPELQAELSFGVQQSRAVDQATFLELFETFLKNDEEWDEANQDILNNINNFELVPAPGMEELESAVSHEINYQKALWGSDPEVALEAARQVVACLKAPELRGYRALWHYLSGAAAMAASKNNGDPFSLVATDQYREAKKAAPNISWLASLATTGAGADGDEAQQDTELRVQVERMEVALRALGTVSDQKFEKQVAEILQGLNSSNHFEAAHVTLGTILGFDAGNVETDAAPDPWWLGQKVGIVFEDHADGSEGTVFGANKARQAASHPKWIRENLDQAKDMDVYAVLITPCTKAGIGAKPHLKDVGYWKLEAFIEWANEALATVRKLKASLPSTPDLAWRAEAAETLLGQKLTISTIATGLPTARNTFKFLEKP